MEQVDLISAGYEWVCSKCGELNTINAIPKHDEVICLCCEEHFEPSFPEHCFE